MPAQTTGYWNPVESDPCVRPGKGDVHYCLTWGSLVASRNLCVSEPQFTPATEWASFCVHTDTKWIFTNATIFITETPNQNYFSVPESIYLNNVGWFSSYYSP